MPEAGLKNSRFEMNVSVLAGIIKKDDRYKNLENGLVFDFSDISESARFYNDQFSDNEHSVELVKKDELQTEKIPAEILPILEFLKTNANPDSIIIEIGGSYLQHRSGFLEEKYPYYFPLDISRSSMIRYSALYNKASLISNAEKLPFKDESIDCLFSHTILEHTIDPDAVLQEASRIVRKGGFVIHCDAWHCRWWQRYGIVGIKKFSDLNVSQKVIYLAAKITEFPLFRMPVIISRRLGRTLFGALNVPIRLKFRKLQPNYSLHLYCDEDAASSIDPLDVIRFYESRGFKYYKSLSFLDRIFFRNPFVILVKEQEF